MPRKNNKYQYDTSPRKLEPEYMPVKSKIPKKSTTIKPNVKKDNKSKKRQTRPQTSNRQRVKMLNYIIIGFVILFAISYRHSQIDENFVKVKTLEQELSEIAKENAQLEISIENSLNLNDIEQQAKELLGMQKLNGRQTIYVTLPKTDYIEIASESVITEEEVPIFQRIINEVVNIFK